MFENDELCTDFKTKKDELYTNFKTKNGFTFTARYLGINTPESTYKVEPWGFAASKYTKQQLKQMRRKYE